MWRKPDVRVGRTGLKVTAELDDTLYLKGIKITDRQMRDLETQHLTRHDFHPEWNYNVSPAPQPELRVSFLYEPLVAASGGVRWQAEKARDGFPESGRIETVGGDVMLGGPVAPQLVPADPEREHPMG